MNFCFPPALDRLHDYSVGTPAVATQHVLDPLDGDPVTEDRAEKRKLATTELWAALRCLEDRAVVFNQLDRAISDAPALGHIALVASDPRKGGDAFFKWPVLVGHLRAIACHLFPRPLDGQAFQAFFSGGALNCLEHVDRELRVGVRESIVGLERELPYPRGPTDLPPLIREIDHPLSLKY